jgi:protein tyrosine phosphatase (PTP) superfamily phosphohydrolase (DUF442 family)
MAGVRLSAEAAEVLAEFKPPVVSFHFGLPSADLPARVKGCCPHARAGSRTSPRLIDPKEIPVKTLLPSAIAAFGLVASATASHAQAWSDPPPNLVQATPQIFTSGQPPGKSLQGLKAQGFEAVVYLAPPTVSDAVHDEARIVGGQGLVFINIPVVFDRPTERDFETFAAVMKALGSRKVLVHCQINLRASSMVFLYRTIVGKEDPARAYDAVSKTWTPQGPWKRLIEEQLRRDGISFEIY